MSCGRFLHRLIRRKPIDLATVSNTQLARCLSLLDLTALGVGSTLGAGIYVVAGQVARETAGPSVVLSFFIAAVASVMAGLCYAEFGSRVPKTGSAYVYSYVTVGELTAFVIGWNLILEYVIGTASVARAWSAYFDSLINNSIMNFFRSHLAMDVPGLSQYPDLFALAITLLLTVVLAVGVKESTRFNNIFTGVNLMVVLYVIVCGLFKVDIKNWKLTLDQIPSTVSAGTGGFFPFGFGGMMSGAATCFYAFIGFDCIATTGEEAINPERNIPISIVVSLLTIFLGYSGISAVLTLICPYYLLDSQVPLPLAFARLGWDVAKYFIAVGAVCGLSTSLLGAMFPMPRVIYAMAGDGIIFRFLARINKRFKTPLVATILSGLLSGIMAMLFDLKELVDMMSIGTLLAYTLVAVSVLIIRYMQESSLPGAGTIRDNDDQPETDGHVQTGSNYDQNPHSVDTDVLLPRFDDDGQPPICDSSVDKLTLRSLLSMLFNPTAEDPTPLTEKIAIYCIGILGVLIIVFSTLVVFLEDYLADGAPWMIFLLLLIGMLISLCVVVIWRQPQNKAKVNFKVPFLPVLPAVSSFINIYLMLKLSIATWVRFGVWMAIGFLIYFTYGIRHSSLENPKPSFNLDDDDDDRNDDH